MNKTLLLFAVFITASAFLFFGNNQTRQNKKRNNKTEPYEFFVQQRAYPDAVFDEATFKNNMLAVQADANNNSRAANFNAAWTLQGPQNIGGRINCVAVHPTNTDIMLEGNAAGGIFKTIDGGQSWYPVFDQQSFLSVSCIAYDLQNPNIVYAGTGDRNMTRYTFSGNGLYRSTDGGETWASFALQQQGIVSKIIVNPLNGSEIFAACMGSAFVRDSLRGVYHTTDAGQTWNRILIGSTEAGCPDMVMHPQDTNVLYAATWNSIRNNQENVNSGNDSKLYKTIDGGNNWTIVPASFNSENNGRISMDISQQDGNKLYVCVVDTFKNLKGIFKTINGGSNWTALDVSSFGNELYGSNGYWFGWYFGLIKVNPWNDEQVFVGGIELWASFDGGNFWQQNSPPWWTYEVHADMHDLRFTDSTTYLLTTDGGMYSTQDLGTSYTDIENIPNTQLYRVASSPFYPNMYFAGAQDNGTMGGSAADIQNWIRIYGGDGFRMMFHPTDSNLFYMETQWGGMVYTTDGGGSVFDFTSGIDFADRINWDFPYTMNRTNPGTLYCGTNCVYKMDNAPFGTWVKMSNDITDGNVLGSTSGQSFNVISAIDNSKKSSSTIYAGTTDANVWRSTDDCNTWQNITGTLPNRYVTSVKASPNDSNVVFVSHSGYRANDNIAHVHKSIDKGNNWLDISGNLPQLAVNDLLILPGSDSVIFAATDGGVYATLDGGNDWQRLGSNMPVVPVFELGLNKGARTVFAGTHGRSIYSYSLDSLGVEINEDTAIIISAVNIKSENAFSIFPNPATDFVSIQTTADNFTATLYDLTGNVVLEKQNMRKTETLNIASLPSGTFLIQIADGKTKRVKKLVKI